MAVNKVIYGTTVLVDLTEDTVTPADLSEGVTAHDKSGALITGTNTGGSMVIRDTEDSHGGTVRTITAGSVITVRRRHRKRTGCAAEASGEDRDTIDLAAGGQARQHLRRTLAGYGGRDAIGKRLDPRDLHHREPEHQREQLDGTHNGERQRL